MTDAPPPTVPAADGRIARRQRGRLAVTNAMIDLVFEGYTPPTAEQVARRAGVSVASLFRYFDTLEDLREHATERYFERFFHLFEVPEIGVGSLERRIASLVTARVELHRTTAPIARLTRSRSLVVTGLNETLRRLNATQADQIRLHFGEELAELSPARRDDLVATIATITSFESWDRFQIDHGRTPAQTRRAWTGALSRLLESG